MDDRQLDVHSTKSGQRGLAGFFETLLRRFRTTSFMILLVPLFFLCMFCMGLSLAPGVILFDFVFKYTTELNIWTRGLALGLTLSSSFFLYGFTLILVVPLVNRILPLRVQPLRATWFSLSVIPWYYHNALTYLVRYTFLDFITPTPMNKFYFQLMGMKVGKGSIINTSNISDPCLIEIGENVTVGGSATLVAHYGMRGVLIIDRLVIGDDVTIGLRACLFGKVTVGQGVTVRPYEVVLPNSRIEAKRDT